MSDSQARWEVRRGGNDAVTAATSFVLRAIRAATPVGGGAVPLNHLVPARG